LAEIGSYCTHCGAKVEPNSKFCASCGRATSSVTEATPAQETKTTAAVLTPASRPTGVTVVAILNILAGITMFTLVIAAAIGASISPSPDTVSGVQTIGGILIAVGTISFVVAYGLLKGRPWAWTLTVVISIIAIVMTIFTIVWLGLFGIINAIFSGIVLYYLYRPQVKAYFGKTARGSGRPSEIG
jgi:hypothetical protein